MNCTGTAYLTPCVPAMPRIGGASAIAASRSSVSFARSITGPKSPETCAAATVPYRVAPGKTVEKARMPGWSGSRLMPTW
jgi:hypothetical protein